MRKYRLFMEFPKIGCLLYNKLCYYLFLLDTLSSNWIHKRICRHSEALEQVLEEEIVDLVPLEGALGTLEALEVVDLVLEEIHLQQTILEELVVLTLIIRVLQILEVVVSVLEEISLIQAIPEEPVVLTLIIRVLQIPEILEALEVVVSVLEEISLIQQALAFPLVQASERVQERGRSALATRLILGTHQIRKCYKT